MNTLAAKDNKEFTQPIYARQLSRRDFLLFGALSSGCLGLTLSGCAGANPIANRLTVIQDWLDAANALEPTKFLSLHTDGVAYYSYQFRNPRLGQEELWSAFQASAASHLEDSVAFGTQQMVCIQTTSLDETRSHCYVLVFKDDLIDKVYEYAALYNISEDTLNQKRIQSRSNEVITKQIEIADRLTDSLNERDYDRYTQSFHQDAIVNGFLSTEPLVDVDAIKEAATKLFEAYPNAQYRHYHTFGQGNLVCQQVSVEHGPVRSLSFVHLFEDEKIASTVEYFSHAKLIDI